MKSLIFIFLLPLTAHAGLGPIDNDISRSVGDSRYVNVTGDTMTGTLNGLLSTWSAVRAGEATISGTMTVQGNSGTYGLTVSSNVSLAGFINTVGGKVGINTTAPTLGFDFRYPGGGELVLGRSDAVAGGGKIYFHGFSGDTPYYNTAMLGAASAGLQFQTDPTVDTVNGLVTRMTITSAGNVGIGTTAPESKLHVAGNIALDSASVIKSTTSDGTDSSYFYLAGGGSNGATRGATIALGGNESAVPGQVFIDAGNVTNGTINLRTGSSATRMIVLANGNIGVGVTPTTLFEVNGGVTASSFTATGNAFSVGVSTLVVTQGNVGIGTTAPGKKLTVQDGVILSSTTAGFGVIEGYGSTGGCLMFRDTDNAGWTKCKVLDGTMSCETDADGVCD